MYHLRVVFFQDSLEIVLLSLCLSYNTARPAFTKLLLANILVIEINDRFVYFYIL